MSYINTFDLEPVLAAGPWRLRKVNMIALDHDVLSWLSEEQEDPVLRESIVKVRQNGPETGEDQRWQTAASR